MQEAADDVATGAVTVASRDVETNGLAVSKGAWLGLADGPAGGRRRVVRGGDAGRARAPARRAAQRADAAHRRGAAGARRVLAELERGHPELELEVHEGGQPHYALLISAE